MIRAVCRAVHKRVFVYQWASIITDRQIDEKEKQRDLNVATKGAPKRDRRRVRYVKGIQFAYLFCVCGVAPGLKLRVLLNDDFVCGKRSKPSPTPWLAPFPPLPSRTLVLFVAPF